MAIFNFISTRGDTLSLSESENFKLVKFDGQTTAKASLSSMTVAGDDGDNVNSAQVDPRTVILDLKVLNDVEITKRDILSYFKIKKEGTITWEQDERNLEIKGVVEDIDLARWEKSSLMQITLHCAQPFWENIDYIVERISEIHDLHYFTTSDDDMLFFPEEGIPLGYYDDEGIRAIYNSGDVAVGIEIEIVASGTVTNPIIYNQDGAFFGCGYGTDAGTKVVMSSGDIIKINTRKNEKSMTLNGVSILSKMKEKSTWLQLDAGLNKFSVTNDEEKLDNFTYTIKYKQRYI